jgi:hypothetical protein
MSESVVEVEHVMFPVPGLLGAIWSAGKLSTSPLFFSLTLPGFSLSKRESPLGKALVFVKGAMPFRGGGLQLPEDVLVRVLGNLDVSELRTVRLVCKAFRAASIPCITVLTLNSAYETSHALRSVGHRLRVLTSVTSLNVRIHLPKHAWFLQLADVASTLSKLKLLLWDADHQEAAFSSLAAVAPALAAATRLTSLELVAEEASFPEAGIHVASAVRACRALRELTIAVPLEDYQAVAAAILEVPALHALNSELDPAENLLFWEAIAQSPHRMSRFQSLEGVALIPEGMESRVVPQLADLTQLTCLEMVRTGWSLELLHHRPRGIAQLSLLSALQVLRINGNAMRIGRLRAMILPMVGLRELSLSEWDPDMQGLDSLVTALPALTKLSLGSPQGRQGRPRPPLPARFQANGIVRLCDLSMHMYSDSGEDVLRICRALTGLQRLHLVMFGDQWRRILDGFPAMPFLTELRFEAGPRGIDPVGATGGFLAGLPQLKCLTLHQILDVAHGQQEIGHIAGLTQLTYLELDSDDELHMPYNPVMFAHLHPLTALEEIGAFCGPRWLGAVANI